MAADSIHILVVDPDDQIATEYISALAQANARVDHAHSLAEAFILAAKTSYDVAIIDMLLPDSVGSDAWHRLKSLFPELRGILTTSSPVLHKSIDPGEISAYLLKPFKMDVLKACIAVALSRQGTDSKGLPLEPRAPAPPAAFPADFKVAAGRSHALPIAMSAVILLLVLIFGSVSAAAAAGTALPGDTLYPVKTSLEGLQLALTFDNSEKVQVLLDQAQTRADEVNTLIAQGRSDGIEVATGEYEMHVDNATALLNVLAHQDHRTAAAAAKKLDTALAHSATVLQRVLAKVPAQAKPAITHALAVSQAGRLNAEQELANPDGGASEDGTMVPSPTNTGTPEGAINSEPSETPEPSEAAGPPGLEQTPPGLAQTPPGQDQVPPGQNQVPPGQNQTPPGQNQVPPGQNQTPPGQAKTPPGQGNTPPGQGKTPGPKK